MAFPKAPAILATNDLRVAEITQDPKETRLRIYAWMHLARFANNRLLELFRQGLIRGTVTGGQGNEWMIVPLTLLADKKMDVISLTHRDFGGQLVWGRHLCEHLNQYFANADSPTHAREGNIHYGDPANHSLPMISHLGAMCGPVLGATDSQRRFGRAAVGFAFFGDGSSSTGDVHESMNLASLMSLPIVFVIGLADGQFPGRRSIEAGDVEEERRLFYVAVTRARNELYLCYPKIASRPGPGGMMHTPSRFLQELSPDVYQELKIKRLRGW